MIDLLKRKPSDGKSWMLVDCYIFALTMHGLWYSQPWFDEDEKILKAGIIDPERLKSIKDNAPNLWSTYSEDIGDKISLVYPCSRSDFIRRVNEFPQAIPIYYIKEPLLLRSLICLLNAQCYKRIEFRHL